MKRLSLFLALSFCLLSFGLANAINFDVIVDNSYMWDDGGTMKIVAGQDFKMELQMQNNDGVDWVGYSMPFKFYAEGDIAAWTYVPQTGGYSGYEFIVPQTTLWVDGWASIDTWTVASLDGVGQDTLNHSVLDLDGWIYADDQELLTRYEFWLNVPMTNPTDEGNICIDSIAWPDNPDYDWLFDPSPQNFGGPYCFPVKIVPNLCPVIQDPDAQLITQHHVAFDVTYDIVDPEGDPIVSVGASIGTATLVGGNQINWTYDPLCAEVGTSMSVDLWALDAFHGTCTPIVIDLVVNNTAPVIAGDCGETITIGTGAVKPAEFTATDANTGDTQDWSVTVAPAEPVGPYSIVGGVLTFTPDDLDDNMVTGYDFTFTVTVEDCAGATASCDVVYHVISELPFKIKIEKLEDVYQAHHAYVPVIYEEGSEEMHGFDFNIAYDNSALSFMGAVPGVLFDMPGDYEWEYFIWRFGDNCGGGCPSGLLNVVAIADQNDGPHHPVMVGDRIKVVPAGTVLFTLDFMVTNDRTLDCMYIPIQFFWEDCGDNTIAFTKRSEDILNVKLAIDTLVFAYNGTPDGYDITQFDATFPTYYGAPDECLGDEPKTAYRFIFFYNGGIDIICADSIDARGDMNLNGVANEIADAVVFTNYFIYGMAAFQINVEGQIAASDVNADGIPLSVADLVYLIRTVVGDVLPIPKLSPYAVEAHFGHANNVVTSDVELGAALFVLEGNADVSLADGAAGMEMKTAMLDGNRVVLVYSFDQGRTASGNVLNTSADIVSVEAADYNGSAYKTINLPTSFTLQNYPNPFNPTTTFEFALPMATNVTIQVYNVAGQKVYTHSDSYEAGIHHHVFDGENLASGIYFYKMDAGSQTLTKKMVLLK